MSRFWPRSLLSQMLLSVAVALLLAQGIGAMLVYRAQAERREAAQIHNVAFRFLTATRGEGARLSRRLAEPRPFEGLRGFRVQYSRSFPLHFGERRDHHAEEELGAILAEQDMRVMDVVVARRKIGDDPVALARAERRLRNRLFGGEGRPAPEEVLLAGVKLPDGQWLTARTWVPPGERQFLFTLIGQTLLLYLVLVSVIALILRRITRPLAALTDRLARFGETRSVEGQMAPEGPDDVRHLIVAHNAMEARIVALLDEKDVMLGAIGHDLKTPLAALRVRIESVEDETERERMAATIEDITRSLDDILSLARVGRPSDPREQAELSALVASVVEEFEDMGQPVELGATERIALPLRSTWLRRALRNLIGNAVRYGGGARVSLSREGRSAAVRIDDDGPGIPDEDIAQMMEPFTRGEPSRNSETGGAGLGLTLARAIADQHGGSLELRNRRTPDGRVAGLTAVLRLPA